MSLIDKLRYGWDHDKDDGNPEKSKKSKYSYGGEYSDNGYLSGTQTSLHREEMDARDAGDYERAAVVRHMLSNADSRSHWESKAEEMRDMYLAEGDREAADAIYKALMNNARNAPNR
jgi:hypothetical protein